MKIVQEYDRDILVEAIEVNSAEMIAPYTLRVFFNDKTEKVIDFKPFLLKAVHPSITKYIGENYFNQFTIVNGNLNWNDYDLIFPVHDLHEGTITG